MSSAFAEPSRPGPGIDSLFASAPGLHLVLAADLTVLAAGGVDLSVAVVDPARLRGRDVFTVFPAGAGDEQVLRDHIDQALRHRRGLTAVRRYRDASATGGSETRRRTATTWPVPGADGEVTNVVHRVEDVTDSGAERAVLARVSHDLRGPLTAILGFGELLALGDLAGEHRDWAAAIVAAAGQLLRILDEELGE